MSTPKRVLVVEDDVHISKLITVLLQDAEYGACGDSASMALALLADQQPTWSFWIGCCPICSATKSAGGSGA